MIDEYVKLISCFHQINFCGGKDKTIFQNATKNKKERLFIISFCTPSGTRTLDPLIKSQLLYQLS